MEKRIMKQEQKQIDPNVIIDVATGLISDKPPKTIVGRILRWIKGINKIKNDLGIKIKKPS
jgi:hypothetical protein